MKKISNLCSNRTQVAWISLALAFVMCVPSALLGDDNGSKESPKKFDLVNQSNFLGDWDGQRSKLSEKGISFSGFWQNDFFSNIDNGDKTNASSGAGNWSRIRGTLDIDMNKLAHVKGMSLHITSTLNEGLDVGGDSRYMGSLVGAMGNDTINHQLRLDSWWVKQDLFKGKVSLYAGQISGFDFFGFIPQNFSHFASLGQFYAPLALYNSYSSVDPMTTPSAMIQITPNKHFYWRAMVQTISESTGTHTRGATGWYAWDNDSSGIDTKFRDGVVLHNEVAYMYEVGKDKKLPGEFHFGVSASGAKAYNYYFRDAAGNSQEIPGFQQNSKSGMHNFYWWVNQTVWHSRDVPSRNVQLGTEIVYGPSDKGVLPYNKQVITTAVLNGIIPERPKDSINFAFNYLGIRDSLKTSTFKSEKVYEFNYSVQVTPWLQLMPDLQFHQDIGANPMNGTGTVVGLRSFVNF